MGYQTHPKSVYASVAWKWHKKLPKPALAIKMRQMRIHERLLKPVRGKNRKTLNVNIPKKKALLRKIM